MTLFRRLKCETLMKKYRYDEFKKFKNKQKQVGYILK